MEFRERLDALVVERLLDQEECVTLEFSAAAEDLDAEAILEARSLLYPRFYLRISWCEVCFGHHNGMPFHVEIIEA